MRSVLQPVEQGSLSGTWASALVRRPGHRLAMVSTKDEHTKDCMGDNKFSFVLQKL